MTKMVKIRTYCVSESFWSLFPAPDHGCTNLLFWDFVKKTYFYGKESRKLDLWCHVLCGLVCLNF